MAGLAPRALALARALAALEAARDILLERAGPSGPPAWSTERGLAEWLTGWSDDELRLSEECGLHALLESASPAARRAPAPLVELVRELRAAAALPWLRDAGPARSLAPVAGLGPRKRAQVDALVSAIEDLARGRVRVVDVGAGKGHFGRVAALELGVDVVGLERDPARVRRAAELAGAGARARFEAWDATLEPEGPREGPFAPGDLLVGLHACGEVGDLLVDRAACAGADVALVSCCLQKIRGPVRAGLSSAARDAGFSVPRAVLGLSNATPRAIGVERATADNVRAREARLALGLLLEARGLPVAPGAEARGFNRRRAHRGLEALAESVLASRGLEPASPAELARAATRAASAFASMRRHACVRAVVAELLEVTVNLDRAARLEEAGKSTLVARCAPPDVTPRNVTVFAARDERALPETR